MAAVEIRNHHEQEEIEKLEEDINNVSVSQKKKKKKKKKKGYFNIFILFSHYFVFCFLVSLSNIIFLYIKLLVTMLETQIPKYNIRK